MALVLASAMLVIRAVVETDSSKTETGLDFGFETETGKMTSSIVFSI